MWHLSPVVKDDEDLYVSLFVNLPMAHFCAEKISTEAKLQKKTKKNIIIILFSSENLNIFKTRWIHYEATRYKRTREKITIFLYFKGSSAQIWFLGSLKWHQDHFWSKNKWKWFLIKRRFFAEPNGYFLILDITFYNSEHLSQPVVKAEGNHYAHQCIQMHRTKRL